MKNRILILSFLIVVAFTTHAFAQGIHITPVDTIWPDTSTYDTRVSALSSLGDINGDGFEDLGVAFSSGWFSDLRLSSKVIIYFGNAECRFMNTWNYYFEPIEGEEWNSVVTVIKRIGDVNNDGWDDVALGMPGYTWWGYCSGRVWVFYGGPTMDTIPDWEWTAEHTLYYHYFGEEIQDAGDWNDDGYDDFIVSAPWNDSGGEGDVYLILGGNPPDTAVYLSWRGVAPECRLRCEGTLDINEDGKKELIFHNTMLGIGDSIITKLVLMEETLIDTLLVHTFGRWESYLHSLLSYKSDSSNFLYSSYWQTLTNEPDGFKLWDLKWRDDSLHINDIDFRSIFSSYDSNFVPILFNINELKDIDGDFQNEIIGELYYSERTWSDAFYLGAKGKFVILDPDDDYNLLYISDTLFQHDAYYMPRITVSDFNGDGSDEIFVGNTAFHDHEYGFLVFTTGYWEGIEDQIEITSQNSLAGSFGNTIHFDLNMQTQAEITLYDITGRKVREESIDARKGRNSISFTDLNSGIYLYRLRFNETNEVLNGKLVNIK